MLITLTLQALITVLPNLSLDDIITTVENLTLDKVNNFVPRQPFSSKKTGGVHSNSFVTISYIKLYI